MSTVTYRTILSVAFPLIISGFSTALLQLTDTIFLSNLDEKTMAACGNASLFYFFLVHSITGFSNGIQIIMARKNGEKDFHSCSEYFMHGLYVLLPLSWVLVLFCHFFYTSVVSLYTSSPLVVSLSSEFIRHRQYGLPFALFNTLFHAYYTAILKTRYISFTTTISVLLNILLDYWFIFGTGPFPAMGLAGAAWASNIAEMLATLLLLFVYLKKLHTSRKLFSIVPFRSSIIYNAVRIASPLMMQGAVAMGAWYVFFNIVEHINLKALMVSHIIRGLYMFFMIPVFAISLSNNTMVSNHIGEHRFEQIKTVLKKSIYLSWFWNGLSFTAVLLSGHSLIYLFTKDPSLVTLTYHTLLIVCIALFLFSAATNLYNTLAGMGYTKTAFYIESLSIAVYLTFSYIVVFYLRGGVIFAWSSEIVYFIVFGTLCYVFLNYIVQWKPKII